MTNVCPNIGRQIFSASAENRVCYPAHVDFKRDDDEVKEADSHVARQHLGRTRHAFATRVRAYAVRQTKKTRHRDRNTEIDGSGTF